MSVERTLTPGFARFLFVVAVVFVVLGALLARSRSRALLEQDAQIAFGGAARGERAGFVLMARR